MLNLFIKLYSCESKKEIVNSTRILSIFRFLVRTVANYFLPIYFKLTQNSKSGAIVKFTNSSESRVIVSLTTFPARISKVWLVIETLLRQTIKPDKIILWLSSEQFSSINELPATLLMQRKRGLEIVLVPEDLRSHKKYYYAIKNYPNDLIITVDDDIFYPNNMIEKMLIYHKQYPTNIIANYVRLIRSTKGKVNPYHEWGFVKKKSPYQERFFFGSGGGTLFPPGVFPQEVLSKNIFVNICRYADDIWLNLLSRINGAYVIPTESVVDALLPVLNPNNTTLASINLAGGNDIQLAAVRKYCLEHFGKDPLVFGSCKENEME